MAVATTIPQIIKWDGVSDNGNKLFHELMVSIKNKPKINLVCYVDDPECDLHANVGDEHQESQQRTKKIREFIKLTGLNQLLYLIGSASVTKQELYKTHDKQYVETIISCGRTNKPVLLPHPSSEISMTNINSLNSIFAAVGSVSAAIDTVCGECKTKNNDLYIDSQIKKVFCNVRPPGHHAHHRNGAGFCFLNNVALGANRALNNFPNTIKKVLIFDWDLHHGDGTEDIFGGNPNVIYASFHRGGENMKDRFYPGTGASEKSKWKNIFNFPIGYDESLDVGSYMDKFNNKFLPIAHEFNPDLIIISAGFDSHKDDLYHQLPLDYDHFHAMTTSLMKLADKCANGRLISVLEGGYTPEVLSMSVAIHLATLINGYEKN